MGITYNPRVVTDGLVLCLDAANKRSYPGTGTVWTDLAGENDCTLTNGPTFSSDNGGVIVFDGTNDYVISGVEVYEAFTSVATNGPFTFDVWAKYDNISSPSIQNLFALRTSSSYTQFGLISDQGRVFKGGGGTLLIYTTPTAGVISNWVLTVDGSNINVYINGSLDASTTSATTQSDSNASLRLGTYSAGQEPFGGNIYCSRLYNRVLTVQEIKQNYVAVRGRFQ